MSEIRYLNWEEFDLCVSRITNACSEKPFSGVFGFPRGGLCLAVALSHSLDIPLIHSPTKGCLVVDDVYETGTTLRSIQAIPEITFFVWFSKVKPDWWKSVDVCDPAVWLVFPWENRHFVMADQYAYKKSLSLKKFK